jgi:sulfur relay (sulfurtransferase) DsrF/TusC family protein
MALKVLNIVETAYRANIEEQDDPVVWITLAMRGAGADLGVVLCGNAVNYAVKGQDASGLSFGDKRQTQPPRMERDIAALIDKGVPVFVVEDDVQVLGLERTDLIGGLNPIARAKLPALFADYDQVWTW